MTLRESTRHPDGTGCGAARRDSRLDLRPFRAAAGRRYRARFAATFDRLADGTLRGRSARAEWGEGIRENLMFVRVERHVVLFLDRPEAVVVTDVLHEAMDLPGRVRG